MRMQYLKQRLNLQTYSSSSRFFLPIDSVMPFVFHWITAGQVVAKDCLVIDWMMRLNCRSKLIICYVFCRHSLREALNRWLMQYVFFTYIYIYFLLRYRHKKMSHFWTIFYLNSNFLKLGLATDKLDWRKT